MKWTKPAVVLRPSLAQADIPLDDLDDVHLLLHGLGEIGHRRACLENKTRASTSECGRVETRAINVGFSMPPSVQSPPAVCQRRPSFAAFAHRQCHHAVSAGSPQTSVALENSQLTFLPRLNFPAIRGILLVRLICPPGFLP